MTLMTKVLYNNSMKTLKSIDLIIKHAKEQGHHIEHFSGKLAGKEHRYTTLISENGKGITFSNDQFTLPSDSRVARAFFSYKHLSYELAERCEIRTLDTLCVDIDKPYNTLELEKVLSDCGQVIVKPNDGARGNGFTGGISNLEALIAAIELAKPHLRTSNMVLVQEQFFGDEARFITIDGSVKGVLLSLRPRVVGDGKCTIAQLIAKNNLERDRINQNVMNPYPYLSQDNIPAELLDSTKVLQKGEKFFLNQSTITHNGALVYNATETIDKSYVDIVERMSKRFGRGMVCVDLFLKDPNKPADDQNYALVEMNEGMSLPMCYRCVDGNHFDIMEIFVVPLLQRILS